MCWITVHIKNPADSAFTFEEVARFPFKIFWYFWKKKQPQNLTELPLRLTGYKFILQNYPFYAKTKLVIKWFHLVSSDHKPWSQQKLKSV